LAHRQPTPDPSFNLKLGPLKWGILYAGVQAAYYWSVHCRCEASC